MNYENEMVSQIGIRGNIRILDVPSKPHLYRLSV